MKSGSFVMIGVLVIIVTMVACTGKSDTPPAPVPKTLKSDAKGVSSPSPRFTDNRDGTVTDNLTGLIWLKDANLAKTVGYAPDDTGKSCEGCVQWSNANALVTALNAGTAPFSGKNCGYTDWRLPTLSELHSLIHYGYHRPALSNAAGTDQWTMGNPFDNVQLDSYWSATTYAAYPTTAWYVYLGDGRIYVNYKSDTYYVWAVRGGQ